jgi:hypothetical protein
MASTQNQKTVSGGSVAGSWSARIPGSIALAVSSFAGKRKRATISLSSIWLALNSSLLRCWFSDKVLGAPPTLSGFSPLLRRVILLSPILPMEKSMKVGAFDILIASTAIHHNLTLVTRNVKDTQRIPQLTLYQAS